jgi:hypothetical protein
LNYTRPATAAGTTAAGTDTAADRGRICCARTDICFDFHHILQSIVELDILYLIILVTHVSRGANERQHKDSLREQIFRSLRPVSINQAGRTPPTRPPPPPPAPTQRLTGGGFDMPARTFVLIFIIISCQLLLNCNSNATANPWWVCYASANICLDFHNNFLSITIKLQFQHSG